MQNDKVFIQESSWFEPRKLPAIAWVTDDHLPFYVSEATISVSDPILASSVCVCACVRVLVGGVCVGGWRVWVCVRACACSCACVCFSSQRKL